MRIYLPTKQEHVIEDYPYSFTLRCQLTSTMDFNQRNGYRHVTETKNPKTGRMNKPKKSVYSPLLVRFTDEGYLSSESFSFNGHEELNRAVRFIDKHIDLFSKGELKYLYGLYYNMATVDLRAKVVYASMDIEELKKLYVEKIQAALNGFRNPEQNLFSSMLLDVEAIERIRKVTA